MEEIKMITTKSIFLCETDDCLILCSTEKPSFVSDE